MTEVEMNLVFSVATIIQSRVKDIVTTHIAGYGLTEEQGNAVRSMVRMQIYTGSETNETPHQCL